MLEFRLGDDTDDFCPKCKRLTNHAIVSLVDAKPGKVRCRTCYHEQMFRDGVPPPSKKDLAKAALFNQVLSGVVPPPPAEGAEPVAEPAAAEGAAAAKPVVRGRKKA